MSGGPELQLLAFDTRRGNAEGQEQDKLLACFPPGLPPVQQSGLAGLLHGLLLFSANFTGTPVRMRHGEAVLGWSVVHGFCTPRPAPPLP